MTDRAPQPEGMSDAQLEKIWERRGESRVLEDFDALFSEIHRLRADGATLKVRADEAHAAHSASFGALQTLSAALFDGEVDDYAALAEKIIARVRQLESDGATLRDAAEMLWVVLANVNGGNWKQQSADWQEAAARWRDNYFAAIGHPPAKGDVAASAPKEPTPR